MDIHKPHPFHGWREFLKEYGIIVLGVLTALGAEQTVEWLHTRHEVAEVRSALRSEILADGAQGLVSSEQNKCLLVYAQKAIAWTKGGPRPPFVIRTRMPMSSVVWDASKTGAVLRMPQDERLKLAGFYAFIGSSAVLDRQVQEAVIGTMRYTRLQRLNPRQAETLEEDLNGLVPLLAGLVVNERNAVRFARRMGLEPKASPNNFVRDYCEAAGAPAPKFEVGDDADADGEWAVKVAAGAAP